MEAPIVYPVAAFGLVLSKGLIDRARQKTCGSMGGRCCGP